MDKMKVAVNGAAGRMGRLIVEVIRHAGDCELVCALEREGMPDLSRDAGEVAGSGPVGIAIGRTLCGRPDVLIDFSSPRSCLERVEACAEAGVAVVVGTTGWDADSKRRLLEYALRIPLFFSANMSIGLNVMLQLVARAAAMLGEDYDIEIVESHHRHKKDAPSGTAMMLAETVCDVRNWNLEEVMQPGRQGMPGERPAAQIGMHAVRGGDIVGDHTVIFAGEGERLECTHRAGSRHVFAVGAVNAARFLRNRPPGLYGMRDMLGGRLNT